MTTETATRPPCPAGHRPRSQAPSRETGIPASTSISLPALEDTRERSDSYRGEILCVGECRIAVCRDGIQWLLQHRRNGPKEGATAAWGNLGFCTSRAALVRLWRAHTGEDGTDLLALLPGRIALLERGR